MGNEATAADIVSATGEQAEAYEFVFQGMDRRAGLCAELAQLREV